ncbi:MAG: hypothetical protein PHW69_03120 [Elusimicrobiaceae bacterium]|nr:hypothetical protein [Elusimicrobiaceae bacterium]
MKKTISAMLFTAAALLSPSAYATPSTQIWIPSTDIQKYKTVHLNLDSYLVMQNNADGTRKAPQSVIGPTVGILPFEKIQMEAGVDLIYQGSAALDNYPLYLHGKVGTPEDAWFTHSPAVAVGLYNAGVKKDLTNQNMFYGLAAKTLPVAGRLSAGYYIGNDKVLLDEKGDKASDGLLLSWDRTMKEISDKLWFCVDYQGGQSALGALNFGFSWAFSENTSVLFGYDVFNNKDAAGKNTATVQVDINF